MALAACTATTHMLVELYHGTSVESANLILKHGFKDRVASGKSRWSGKVKSQEGVVYLTRAYPFFYAMNAAENRETAAVLKVEVDIDDLLPDEDYLRWAGIVQTERQKVDLRKYQHLAERALEKLGNVAVDPDNIKRVLGKKLFAVGEMWQYSDPSMSPLNYSILGGYYRKLTDTWWAGGDWQNVNQSDELMKSLSTKK